MEESDRVLLREEINKSKYGLVIESIKAKLEEGYYRIEGATFIYVSQQIFKYANKGKQGYQQMVSGAEAVSARNTLSMKDLEQHLVMNFFDANNEQN